MAHITGGGLTENIPRVLPDNCHAVIDTNSWDIPAVFQWLQQAGNIEQQELYRTFNCGVGMVLCIPEQYASNVVKRLHELGEDAFIIGHISAGDNNRVVFR